MPKRKIVNEPLYKSAEFIQDSSEEETENSTQKSHLSPPKLVNGKPKSGLSERKSPRAASVSSSDAESGPGASDSSEDSQGKTKSNESDSESSGSSDADEDDTSGSDTNSNIGLQSRQVKLPIVAKPKKRDPAVSIAPKHFKAPEGYERYSLSASDYTSQMSEMFDDLATKQIWHISAPESLPLHLVQTLDIQAALKGDPILTHNGISYNLNSTPVRSEVLLLPSGPEASYRQSEITLSRSFQLTEMVKPSKQKTDDAPIPNGSSAPRFSADRPGQKRLPRQQPEGLKMRYVPYGADISAQLDNDAGDAMMIDQFHFPDMIGEPDLTDPAKKTRKKSKQHKLPDEIELDHKDETKSSKKHKNVEMPTKAPNSMDKSDSTPTNEKRKKKQKAKLVDEEVL